MNTHRSIPVADAAAEAAYAREQARKPLTAEQRAALQVLRQDISDQIDGDSPTDSRYTEWAALADFALGEAIDPWMLMTLRPQIKTAMEKT